MPNRTFSGSISSGYTTAHSVHKLMHAMLLLLAFTLCQGQIVDGDEDVDTTFKDAKDTIEEYLNEKYEDDLSGEKIDLVWDEDEDKYKINIGDDEQDKDWAEGFDDASAINDGDLTSGEWDKMKPFGEKSEMEEELNERFEDELETDEKIELKWDVNENAYAVEIDGGATPDGDWVEDLAGKDGLMTETEWNAFNNTDYLTIEYWTDNHWVVSDHEVSYYWGPVLLLGVIVIIAVMFCRGGNENSHQMGHGHYQPQSGYNSSYRRRRLPAHPTLTKLCPGDQSLVSNLPRPARMLLRDSPHISCCANKIDDDLMYKIVGLSCIAQFSWLFVGYQVYKYCKHARKPRTEQEHHELREITVVRH